MERKAALLVGQCLVTTSRMIFQQRISSLCMDLDVAEKEAAGKEVNQSS